jgi:hypothetical protein
LRRGDLALRPFELVAAAGIAYDEVDDGSPAVPVVHVVSESGGVNDRELDLELLLLELGLDDVYSG